MKPLRPQDVYILLALVAWPEDEDWTYEVLSNSVGLSLSQVYRSLDRATSSHLFDKDRRRVRPPELLEFLAHGLRYAFPAHPGPRRRGTPTCWQAPVLEELMSTSEPATFVWPDPAGSQRGQAIDPLHKAVPGSITEHDELYRLLALSDILRVGSARERNIATEELEKVLL